MTDLPTTGGIVFGADINRQDKEEKRKNHARGAFSFKLKTGQTIENCRFKTQEAIIIVKNGLMRIGANEMGPNEVGAELYHHFDIIPPVANAGCHWMFRHACKINGLTVPEPKVKEPKKPRSTQIDKANPNENMVEVKKLADTVTKLHEQVVTLAATVASLAKAVDETNARMGDQAKRLTEVEQYQAQIIDDLDRITRAEGVYVTNDPDGSVTFKIPTAALNKQVQIIETGRVEDVLKGKKIVFIGGFEDQVRHLADRLVGARIIPFSGKADLEAGRLRDNCASADLIVCWTKFINHAATEITKSYKNKTILTGRKGINRIAESVIEYLTAKK